jgi:glycosyltransferase involved in cell wall biosynthesis
MRNNRVLITSPSLNVKENVSGISSLVSDIIQSSRFPIIHFTLGSKDGEKKNIPWAWKQVVIYFRAVYVSLFKPVGIVHLNVGLETFSIVRDSLILFITKKIFRKKLVLHIHGGYYLMHAPTSRVLAFFMRFLFHNADAVIVLSKIEMQILGDRYGIRNFFVFPNAVNISHAGSTKPAKQKKTIGLIFMGRIAVSKGIYTICESFKYLQDYFDRFSFEIYGAGPELEKWLAILKQYPGLHYCYKGITSGKEKWDTLGDADVFLLPSLHSEGLPVAMIEAMAAGCVVIATNDASISTVITNDVNGILISKDAPLELAQKIKDILDGKVNCMGLSVNAQEYVTQNMSISTYIKQLDELYAGLN